MKAKREKGRPNGSEPTPGAGGDELPERWSVQRKTELVPRLLRGEPLDTVSRESQIPAHGTGKLEARHSGDRDVGAEDAWVIAV